jgi:hypothetical protein
MASNYALLRRHFQERVLGNKGFGLSVCLEAKPIENFDLVGAGRGNRTPMKLPSADFESAASASSAIPASKEGKSSIAYSPISEKPLPHSLSRASLPNLPIHFSQHSQPQLGVRLAQFQPLHQSS